MDYNLITILGPTATGKTKLSAKLANHFKGEIISADSRQVYKKMDIGTGKDYSDYIVDGINIPYHLVDVIEPEEEFNLFLFISHFKDAFGKIISQNKIPFLTGGTGLYISSVIQNYQIKEANFSKEEINKFSALPFEELRSHYIKLKPKHHNKTDLEDKERLIKAILVAESGTEPLLKGFKINSLVIGVRLERTEVKERITGRLKKRLNEGMIDEVKMLLDSGLAYERLLNFGLEYKFIALYLKGELSYNEMFLKLNSAISAFAKRQMTWFRKMEREGVKINWIEKGNYEKAAELISINNFVSDFNYE